MSKTTNNQSMTIKKAIEEYQCPGCVVGSNTSCGSFKLGSLENGEGHCENHCAGTMIIGHGKILLGMPVGFNKIRGLESKNFIHFMDKDHDISFDYLNIPVWAMEQDNNLLVKVVSPRTLSVRIEVYIEKKMEDLGEWKDKVFNVADFQNKID